MNVAIKHIILFIAFGFPLLVYSQKGSERLKKEQEQLQRQIETTKSLVDQSRKQTKLSLEEVQLIDRQVKYREQLLNNIDNQIKASELRIKQKEQSITQMSSEIEQLKKQYADLLLYAYKKRNKYGAMMYIFSASSIEEAIKRKLYLEKLSEIQKKQLKLIRQNMEILSEEIESLAKEQENKLLLADQKREERKEIIKTKKEKEQIYEAFKTKENEILAELKLQEEKNNKLKQEIQKAIQREIAEEQARIEKARREAEAKRRAEAEKEGKTIGPEEDVANIPFVTTKEVALAGANFAANRGKLPWPVEKGTITQNYGKNPHPTIQNVFTQNNGIDISTIDNAEVRSLFKGVVRSVLTVPGTNNVVIIRHGNYLTVYANLSHVYVRQGDIVDTKQLVGRVFTNDNEANTSVLHLEIWEENTKLDPVIWLSQQ